jgi:hypothetical protein
MSKEEAKAITQAGVDIAEQIIAEGDTTATSAIASGMQIKEDEIAAGKQAAEEIQMLATAALMEQSAIEEAENLLLSE